MIGPWLLGWMTVAALAGEEAADSRNSLPVVVLVGDSIRMSYADVVADRLRGRARVVSVEDNGSFSRKVLYHLDDWVIRHRPSVVHFNAGLHDIMTDPATGLRLVEPVEYRANLRAIARRLDEETSARLIFATTTPVLESRRGEPIYLMRNADIRAYNDLARRTLARWPTVVVDDLHARALDFGLGWALSKDGVHLTRAGSVALGEAVADSIRRALTDPPVAWAIECPRASRPPTLDGQVDGDLGWERSFAVGPFAQFWAARALPDRTAVRLSWGDRGLFYAAALWDDHLVVADRRANARLWLGDALGLVVWAGEDQPTCREFQVDPRGASLQLAVAGPDGEAEALVTRPSPGMVAVATAWEDRSRSARGWAVEGLIPWAALGSPAGPPLPGASWRVVIFRTDSDRVGTSPTLSAASPLRRPDVHRRGEASRLIFVP